MAGSSGDYIVSVEVYSNQKKAKKRSFKEKAGWALIGIYTQSPQFALYSITLVCSTCTRLNGTEGVCVGVPTKKKNWAPQKMTPVSSASLVSSRGLLPNGACPPNNLRPSRRCPQHVFSGVVGRHSTVTARRRFGSGTVGSAFCPLPHCQERLLSGLISPQSFSSSLYRTYTESPKRERASRDRGYVIDGISW